MLKHCLALLLLFAATPALACKCRLPSGTDAQRAGNGFAEHALVGVMEVTGSDKSGVVAGTRRNGLVEMTLRENFKGTWLSHRPYLVDTGDTSCGVVAHPGQLWLVYANSADALTLSQCDKSAPLLQRLGHIGTLFDLRERALQRAGAKDKTKSQKP